MVFKIFSAVDSVQAWPSSSVGRKSPWFVALTNNCKSPQQSREQVRMWFVPGGELPG